MSSATLCVRPLRARSNSVAASAAAAIAAWAALPTANDDGITGSAPVRAMRASASAGRPASRHSAPSAADAVTDYLPRPVICVDSQPGRCSGGG